MTDPITRARREWCETPRYPDTRMANICPPDVVAALLDVLDNMLWTLDTLFSPDDVEMQKTAAHVAAAKAAITRALEGK